MAAGGRMVEFAGWHVPLLYGSILDEHAAARGTAAVFDVSHMGRLRIRGDWAFKLLDRACTADVLGQEDDTVRYSLLCNESGGVLDDVSVSRLADYWLVVCNADNHQKVLSHLQALNEVGEFDATIEDLTDETAMLAVQGPEAMARLAGLLPAEVTGIGRYEVASGTLGFLPYVATRTGYTGEDGLEVIVPAAAAAKAWEFVTGEKIGVAPAGLGARDVLRIEAGLPLYGHELNETIDPITAGLARVVREGGSYLGASALAAIRRRGSARTLVGLKLDTRRIARQGAEVLIAGREAGVVTSGTFSPSCGASIAMAYVDRSVAETGREATVRVGADKQVEGVIVNRPFHRGTAFGRRPAAAEGV